MDWPSGPLETQRRFEPRFCPRRDCVQHRPERVGAFEFKRDGGYRRADGRRVQRYRCHACGGSFSKQAFAFSYYLKRPALVLPVAAGLQAGSAHRQIARSLGCAPSTVTRLAARLGRHGILLLARALGHLAVSEPIVLDHFETFEFTQDYPFGVASAVGQDSWFVYALDPAPHARTGRVAPAQRERLRTRPPRNPRGGYAASCARTARILTNLPRATPRLRVVTDGHEDYRRALQREEFRDRVDHDVHPNPERGPKGTPRSREAVVRDRELFANDLLHQIVRHSAAPHKRETLSFGKRLNALMERFFLLAVWRNFVKGVSERQGDPTTPAMRVGLTDRPWSWERVLARRLFPGRERVPPVWSELYRRLWKTPVLSSNALHQLRRAY